MLTKGGLQLFIDYYDPHTSIHRFLSNTIEVSVLTKGGEAILNPDNFAHYTPDTTTIPPPLEKAGFEVWVFSKGGLVCIATCRSVRTVGSHHPVVHAHHVRGGTLTLGCVRV